MENKLQVGAAFQIVQSCGVLSQLVRRGVRRKAHDHSDARQLQPELEVWLHEPAEFDVQLLVMLSKVVSPGIKGIVDIKGQLQPRRTPVAPRR